MSKAKARKPRVDESLLLLASSVTITCPDAGCAVPPNLTVCGVFTPALKCDFRVRCRVYYLNPGGVDTMDEQMIVPLGNNRWTYTFAVASQSGEDVLITARLYSSTGVPLSPLVTTYAVYDPMAMNPCNPNDGTCWSHRADKHGD